MLHVIKETGCHAGHLDAARELIDGRQWIVLDDWGSPPHRRGGTCGTVTSRSHSASFLIFIEHIF